jgi:hypothetical protein
MARYLGAYHWASNWCQCAQDSTPQDMPLVRGKNTEQMNVTPKQI